MKLRATSSLTYVLMWQSHVLANFATRKWVGVVSSLEAGRRAHGGAGPARLELERRSLDLERELRPDRDSDASLDDRDHLV
ncbi:hypothetical protein EVAR_85811_1 [Eumeta japonica]|uniref:Uncharacterized protein n=1 Tax=Eumeta variegata TaxID=151549 RepID=A0A4C1URL0_EUMVA|nr:hypothetical protein EVAR_85811_1 [Eumeta japonica]